MKIEEARAWLKGERSTLNMYRTDVPERYVVVARHDAAKIEQAYWIARAHNGRTTCERGRIGMSKTLLVPRLLGILALALAFTAGLIFDRLWIAALILSFNVSIIWNIVKIGNHTGAIEVYDEIEERRT